jgi:aminoglycoside phosphotransferase (APT) family kinase protein
VAQFRKNQIVLRLPKPEDTHRAVAFYEKEAWCLTQAALLGIPSPSVFQIGVHDGWPFQIQSFVEGVHGAHSDLPPATLWETLGDYARRFHMLAPTGFGESLPDLLADDGLARWRGYVDYNLRSLTHDDALRERGVYHPEQREKIHARFLKLRQQPLRLGLCHGDLAPGNTLVTPDGTLVLLDWGCAEAQVVPHYDLLHVPTEHRAAFLDGYGWPEETRTALLAEVEELALLKAFDLVRWALDRCPSRIDELAEKARVLAQTVA